MSYLFMFTLPSCCILLLYSLFMVRYFPAALLLDLRFSHVALFSCCAFFCCIISWCGSSQLQFLEFALSSYEDISMLQFFFHFGVFSCLTFFILLSLPVDIFSCCTIFIMHFFLCCTFIMLHFLTVIIPSTFFSCLHTHFMLHFFDVAHFS